MITLSPITNIDELKSFYLQHNKSIKNSSGCVVAKSGNDVLGYCFYDLFTDKIVIDALYPIDDLMFADGVLRSTLHVADCRGITSAYYTENAPENAFEKLDFILNKGKKSLKIEKLHQSCAGCAKNQ